MILLSRLSSAELMKRIWQPTASCGVEIRLAAMLLPAYGFACKCGIECGPKRILAENTDIERVTFGRDAGRPFDEAAKIIEIDGLHVVVSRLWTLRLQARNGNQRPRKRHGHEPGPRDNCQALSLVGCIGGILCGERGSWGSICGIVST